MRVGDHVSVCICTYKRPELLARALGESIQQEIYDRFSFEVVVVDNDWNRSAENIVSAFQKKADLRIAYDCEPEKNISLARNRCICNATGNFIAFLDDDEAPGRRWLIRLYNAVEQFGADGALGPVVPYFLVEPPAWIIKGRLFDRERFSTGTVLKAEHMRTGNVLFKKGILLPDEEPFDPLFGSTGGEDGHFFERMTKRGFGFVWCNEACVYEAVPKERLKRTFFLKRGLLRGVSEARLRQVSAKSAVKSLFACSLYTLALPCFFFLGHHLFMKYLIKNCDHVGKLLAFCGVEVLNERSF